MPVLFPSFTSTVAPYLDATNEKTEADTAEIIANSYGAAVASGMITLIPGSAIISAPPTKPIEDAILETFNQIKDSEGPPTPTMFLNWATETVNYWSAITWTPMPPPPGYISPTLGVTVLTGGTPSPLDVDLWSAFNSPAANTPMGSIICGKLISAFTAHLLTVNGLYNGLIPASPSPIPGPPFPWAGVS
tara:strand:+ start:1608 stop:2177 length:570 start_codon:yes stop_codon:yes gene_type:complete